VGGAPAQTLSACQLRNLKSPHGRLFSWCGVVELPALRRVESIRHRLAAYTDRLQKHRMAHHEPADLAAPATHSDQFALLRERRFAPFFWTQFLGAGNDNLFKFALTVLVTYRLQLGWLPPAQAGLVIGALFILPFLLFSATSGQLADKFDKAQLIRFVKSFEVVVMALAAWGYTRADSASAVPLLLGCVFLMGLHSALFGPVKYAYLPQHLDERELTGGNGMVEMGTFVSILLGNLAGGLLMAIPSSGATVVAGACLAVALLGRVVAQWIPPSPPADAQLRINWNPVTETWANLQLAHRDVAVFRSLLGISWMWFFGAVFLSQFPSFAKNVLHGDEQVASTLLAVFSVGVAIGSLLCESLSRRHVEIGLVPLGAIGMSVFAIDLYFASRGLPDAAVYGVGAFFAASQHWRVLADLLLLALCVGLYSVPMYALIQLRSPPSHRARVIAANNILNALFMIVSSVGVGLLLQSQVSVPQVFLITGVLNLAVAFYIFMLVPEYLVRFSAFLLTRCIYRFKVDGGDHIPVRGAALLVCNHVSFVDAVLLMAASPRPIRFLMDHRIFATPVLGTLFRLARAIPIAPQRDDPAVYEAAFSQARAVLADGELLCIFPEGAITRDGELAEFKGGVMKLLDGQPTPVVPMALCNLWGSFFSRIEGTAMTRPFRRGWFSRVRLVVGAPMAVEDVTPVTLRARVQSLLAN
jgi:1-acyl-sn-glycerol-3-phosphate acyltransferase